MKQRQRLLALLAGLFCYGPALLLSDPADEVSDRMAVVLGEALFSKLWVSSPSSTTASDGLGPVYNARACSACHPRGGAGQALDDAGAAVLMRQSEATPESLWRVLSDLMTDPQRRSSMSVAARARVEPGAAARIGTDLAELLDRVSRRGGAS